MRGGDRSALGLWGEAQVAEYLKRRHYRILEARFRCRMGEIDLIASDGTYLCFVEVKLRRDKRVAEAREFVTKAKQQKVRTAAACYLSLRESGLQPRFDVAEVYAPEGEKTRRPEIYYWENAF